jgi:1-deoxyxylulose-5-phosphate synthase
MNYVNLGRSGMKVSRIALGCMSFGVEARAWQFAEADGLAVICQALEAGINFFDTADMYGGGESEMVLGKAIREFARRDEVVIATKIYYPVRPDANGRGLSRKSIFAGIDASLQRLGTNYVDLYQIHRWDYQTPIEETLDALHDVVKSGKVRYLGASSMFAWQLCKALYLADHYNWTRFASMQPHYNLLNREEEREMLPLCRAEGVGVIPWSPLARGRLARRWEAPSSSDRVIHDQTAKLLYNQTMEADRLIVDAVGRVAERKGVSRAQVALAWLIMQPGITAPIVGAVKESQLSDAIAALDLHLDEADCSELTALYVPHAFSFCQELPGNDQDR